MRKPAVIFDMDGVLVDSNPFHRQAIGMFCKQHGFSLSEEELRVKVYGRTNKEWITTLFGTLSDEKLARYAEEKESLFRQLFAKHLEPVKGLIDFLEQLKKEEISCAIATSAPPANVDFILSRIPIRGNFNAILDDRSITHSKPHPEIYLKAAGILGMLPADCVVIEDSLSGVASAKAAGCRVIGITTTHAAHELSEADLVITDFTGLTVETVTNLVHQRV